MPSDGYPVHVEEYIEDVISLNQIVGRYNRVYLIAVYDSDGQLVAFCPNRALADILCLKLTAADRQSRINAKMQTTVVDAETRELPPRWKTNPPPQQLPPPDAKGDRGRWLK